MLGNALRKLLLKQGFNTVNVTSLFQQIVIVKLSLRVIALELWKFLPDLKPSHHEKPWAC